MTTKPTHTPGPWTLGPHHLDQYEQKVYGNVEGGPVARIEFLTAGGTGMDLANARLIAAAPMLLEALRFALSNVWIGKCPFGESYEQPNGCRCNYHDARNAAVAAAEGEK